MFFVDREEVESTAVFGSTDGAFKKYLATDYVGVNADGITSVDTEVTEMGKTDLRDYSFADMKVVFPSSDVAVITYKTTVQRTCAGQDTSGTYNSATVWTKEGGKWHALFHTFVKVQ